MRQTQQDSLNLTTAKHYTHRIISCLFIAFFIVACSTEKKLGTENSTDSSADSIVTQTPDTPTSNTTIIENFDDTPVEPEIIIPEKKPPLTKQQLFADVLGSHNRVREKHGLNPLKWSSKLTDYSQEWADQLGAENSCKMYHRSGTPPYGENLYISSATVWSIDNKEVSRERNHVTITNVVKAWADEEKWYNYQHNSCQPGKRCGHYTQIVWRATTEVGCAMKYCGDESQTWVCSYNPPGNFQGVRPY